MRTLVAFASLLTVVSALALARHCSKSVPKPIMHEPAPLSQPIVEQSARRTFVASLSQNLGVTEQTQTETIIQEEANSFSFGMQETKSGAIASGTLVNGLREGIWRENLDGGLWIETEYKHGVVDGTMTVWSTDGSLSQITTYRHGKPEGSMEMWYASGQMAISGNFKSGLRDGDWLEWHSNGLPKEDSHYVAGKRNERCIFWKIDGNLDTKRSGTYDNGVKIGE